jgi:hypothetical protein
MHATWACLQILDEVAADVATTKAAWDRWGALGPGSEG